MPIWLCASHSPGAPEGSGQVTVTATTPVVSKWPAHAGYSVFTDECGVGWNKAGGKDRAGPLSIFSVPGTLQGAGEAEPGQSLQA